MKDVGIFNSGDKEYLPPSKIWEKLRKMVKTKDAKSSARNTMQEVTAAWEAASDKLTADVVSIMELVGSKVRKQYLNCRSQDLTRNSSPKHGPACSLMFSYCSLFSAFCCARDGNRRIRY